MNAEIKEEQYLFTVNEELRILRDASFFLDKATLVFVYEMPNEYYGDDMLQRLTRGMDFIHYLMDKEYKKTQERIKKECNRSEK